MLDDISENTVTYIEEKNYYFLDVRETFKSFLSLYLVIAVLFAISYSCVEYDIFDPVIMTEMLGVNILLRVA